MNKALKNKLLYWLRLANNEGTRGFCYDENGSDEEWVEFEFMALHDIESFLENTGTSTDF